MLKKVLSPLLPSFLFPWTQLSTDFKAVQFICVTANQTESSILLKPSNLVYFTLPFITLPLLSYYSETFFIYLSKMSIMCSFKCASMRKKVEEYICKWQKMGDSCCFVPMDWVWLRKKKEKENKDKDKDKPPTEVFPKRSSLTK